MKRTVCYQVMARLSIILLLFATFSCKQKMEQEIIPSVEYAPFVNAYTGGLVSQTSTIRVELSQDQPVVELNTEIKKNPFSFSPSLKGKAYWISNNTIEFVPEEKALRPGKFYKATFQLGDFVEIDKELSKFNFSFRVMERNFTVNTEGLNITEADPEKATLKGEIRFSDMVEKAQVEKMFSIKTSDKQSLKLSLEPDANSVKYSFTINDIALRDKDNTLTLAVNGKPLDIDNKVSKEITLPAHNDFRFISATKISQPENGIQVTFSQPLNESQDLHGLIGIPEMSNYTFQVENNKVNVFFESFNKSAITLKVYDGIKSYDDRVLSTGTSVSFTEQASKPAVEITSSGTILPDSRSLIIPFRAVNLYAVDLSVIRIFEKNVLSFMQNNSLDSSYELRRSGRLVYKKMLRLDSDPTKDITQWEDYSVDLSGLIQQEPGAIYRIMFSFKQEYSAYPCVGTGGIKQFSDSSGQLTKIGSGEMSEEDEAVWDIPEAYYNPEYTDIDWRVYRWQERDNPCHPSYYMLAERKASCSVLASNIGIVVKRNTANKLWVAVSNILDTNPIANAEIMAYNFQLQPIGSAKTDANGFAVIDAKGVPFMVVASADKQKGYLKVIDGEDKSLSRFDVGGKEIEKGLKGFIYGERGVWRPGDTLHVSFIMEDQNKRIPDKHPVSFELYNPRGQFYSKQISTTGINGFYTFQVPTSQDDPTGLWNGYIKVGGTSFHKAFRIETVKPNRLKINLDLPSVIKLSDKDIKIKMSSSWLTGATASNLKAKVEMSLSKINTQFKGYEHYTFNNPATDFSSSKIEMFNGTLDKEGNVTFPLKRPNASSAPGMLRANITARVFEPGGDASINTTSVPYSPYSSYVGVNLNQPKNKYIETDTEHVIDVVTLDADGKLTNRAELEYRIYRIGWSWWWEDKEESFKSYVNGSSSSPVARGTIKTTNGKGQFTFRVNYPDWGRYLVYVKDKFSGHASGGTIYIDWPSWRGRSGKKDPDGISMLTFSFDKESYEPGETVTTIIPASSDGRALVSIENGSSVLHREWITVSGKDDTKYQFKVTGEMAPNVYLHVTLLQPHAQTVNDLPIRMYGVAPVFVTNKETVLEPQIKMPDVLRPEKEFEVTVSEKSGKPMTYTLAIVDDGLLDLTNFKTPNPWAEFYAREALGIRTWDMYDDVVGAYTGSFSSLFSVGGDEDMKGDDSKANRFRPVVKFIGPFSIKKGASQTHKLTLPMYVGSVRTMVIAGQDAAYGRADKTTPVRTPLMLLSTLPRVLSIGEDILLPVNVFAMEDGVKDVTVEVESSSNLQLVEGNKKSVRFTNPGDQLVYFKMKVGSKIGKETIKITASGNGHNTKETIEIDVRNPNPVTTSYQSKLLEVDETVEFNYSLGNSRADNWVKLEVSRIPSVDITRRFDFLYNYEHYCSEQLTSRALPLLFITQFKEVDEKEMADIKTNVQEAIKNLYGRQLSNGGFVYWPGDNSVNDWINSYVGIFLVIAREKGYDVNNGVLNKWKAYQRRQAQNWSPGSKSSLWRYWQSDLQQAFRLYSLALAGAPELGAMNRLKELSELSLQAKWRLAAAYALNGKTNAANELIFNAETEVEPYSSDNDVYGSYDRDEAMILETLVLMGRDSEAFRQAQKVSKNLSQENYFSTQSTAFSLMAMGRLAEKLAGTISYDWTLNGNKQKKVKSAKAIYQTDISTSPLSGKVELTNTGKGALYVDLITRTQLMVDTLPAMSNSLRLDVKYVDLNDRPVNITNLKQGTDFVAVVTVANISGVTDYKDIALTHIVPSGWEIYNERMINPEIDESTVKRNYDYRDIRDDRVFTYFNLKQGKSKEFRIRLQAVYAGQFVLPAIQCEAMYDVMARSRTKAGEVTVQK